MIFMICYYRIIYPTKKLNSSEKNVLPKLIILKLKWFLLFIWFVEFRSSNKCKKINIKQIKIKNIPENSDNWKYLIKLVRIIDFKTIGIKYKIFFEGEISYFELKNLLSKKFELHTLLTKIWVVVIAMIDKNIKIINVIAP